jgi:hypothetical protein
MLAPLRENVDEKNVGNTSKNVDKKMQTTLPKKC